MSALLGISHNNTIQYPPILDGVTWSTERKGYPSTLVFTTIKTTGLNFQEGDPVFFKWNGNEVFYGFVFTKQRDKDQHIKVTCYDQLRYFKNKATYVYTNSTASKVITNIIDDFNLNAGTIENTNYVISSRSEDDQTLFDIVQNALDLTLLNTGYLYVMYDKYGDLTLQNISNMRTNILITSDTAENFDYVSSIDSDTYNKIILYYDNDETNTRDLYVAQDSNNQNKWGILQYTKSLDTPTNAQSNANAMLKLYNKKTRNLKVNGAFGDLSCRAGASVVCQLGLGDIDLSNYMVIEKATHKFENNHHSMDLTLIGRDTFIA